MQHTLRKSPETKDLNFQWSTTDFLGSMGIELTPAALNICSASLIGLEHRRIAMSLSFAFCFIVVIFCVFNILTMFRQS